MAFHLADQVGEDEKAEYALLVRRLNERDVPLDFDVEDILGTQSTDRVELLDDVAAKTGWQLAAAREPPEPPDVTLRRLPAFEWPAGWPAVVWVSEREHSRSDGDLLDAPARYLPSPARQLIVSIDWPGFDALINGWVWRS